jgi:malonyl CoA-acyl carrier protein transacylase
MHKKVLGDHPEIKKGVTKIYSIGEDETGMPLRELSDNVTPEQQQDTAIQQPLILANTAALGYSTGDVIRIEGNEYLGYGENNPDDVRIGFSFGELYALVAAGKIPLTSAFRIAKKRGELMSEAGEGTTMAAVIGPEEIEYRKELISFDDYLSLVARESGLDISPAILTSPGNRTVGGPIEDVRNFKEYLEGQGLVKKVVSMEGLVSAAFHTKYFREAAQRLEEYILSEGGVFHPLHQVVVANSDALPYDNTVEGTSRKLGRHISIPVQFQGSVQEEVRRKRFEWIEVVGPKAKILCKGIQRTVQKTATEVMDLNRNLEIKVIDSYRSVKKFIDERAGPQEGDLSLGFI